MIVDTADLPSLRGAVVMVDGGFDPLHDGHVRHFMAAAQLGLPVLCNVSSDAWVGRKHAPLLNLEQRAFVIDALRPISYTHPSTIETVDVLGRLAPRRYVKGSDWDGRLPAEQVELCRREGIEIVFLDTVTNSSTGLLRAYREQEEARR